VPGPLIRARVGDRVKVHFSNALPEDTTVHWHGLRIPSAMDGAPGHSQPPVAAGDFGTLFGREGTVMLVNGKVKPTLKARPGLRQRWRFINAAKARYFQISLDGHTFTRIGGDGGLLSSPVDVAQPVIAPGERMDLLVVPQGQSGAELVVKWIAFEHGFGSTFERPPEDLFAVRLQGSQAETPALPVIARSIVPLSTDGATPVDLQLTAQYGSMPLKLGINGVAF